MRSNGTASTVNGGRMVWGKITLLGLGSLHQQARSIITEWLRVRAPSLLGHAAPSPPPEFIGD